MVVTCPHCGKKLNVPDSAAGRQGRCPACKNILSIAPPPSGVVPVQEVQPAAPAPEASVPPAPTPEAPPPPPEAPAPVILTPAPIKLTPAGGPGGFGLLKPVALFGALLMFVSFFLPWWGVSITYNPIKGLIMDGERPRIEGRAEADVEKDAKKLQEEMERFQKAVEKDDKFQDEVLSKSQKDEGAKLQMPIQQNKSARWSASAFGWRFARGIITFIFGLVAMGLIVPLLLVRFLRRWGWTMMLPAAALGLTALILGLTVWIGTPGQDSPGEFLAMAQGVSIGAFLALGGGFLLAAAGALDGTLGLISFARGPRR